ncbi:hypothetical protein A3C59_00710 [Candidatus Daviesbacteria bacterium RIFCSPHIGHO2_02_FULL_36_13]|uniref:Uncharacterized protein n=1 Tax=Candidatus Daviesbacteria bacterium RIFCSPHIGHO2_02_FULL_36_13 TaxID=1797768 RepID=A0A1F5JZX3_9BACT|nr:MAG: hypothetical protein A3C59_00710 [Candidatus Daviesbacteria bacterium RIFCSPHIGHO2_02_FULL_36_13]OGE41576.1 MAG: hypothetical protein A3A45_03065 [Candidatus Daviesbacteria bacterium RIFCSPLOWO2_01_FULL_36_8]
MQKGFINAPVILTVVVLMAVSFYIGTKYQDSKLNITDKNQKVVENTPTPMKEDLEERCGKIPPEAYPKGNSGWIDLVGPYWSPDCRYVVSSVAVVGRGGTEIPQNVPVGIHLYKDAIKTLNLVYKAKEGVANFTEWTDRENFTFTIGSKKYNYNITNKEVTSLGE